MNVEPPEQLTTPALRQAFVELWAEVDRPEMAPWLQPHHAEQVARLVLARDRLDRTPVDADDWLDWADVVFELELLLTPGAFD